MTINKLFRIALLIAISTLLFCPDNAYGQGIGQSPATAYYVFAKNVMIKPVLPEGAPINPPDPLNNPPTEMDIRVQYEVFQSYCDIQEFAPRDLTPSRTFRGRIGPNGNWEETVAETVISALPSDIPTVAHEDTVDLNKSPMKVYSRKASDFNDNWTEDHHFTSDMSGGPMVALNPFAITGVVFDDNDEIERVYYRVQVGLQTPAPEMHASDLSQGYEFDQEYKYEIYGSSATVTSPLLATVTVPALWRRGATYEEVYYDRDWFDDPEATGSASFVIRRRSKKSGAAGMPTTP